MILREKRISWGVSGTDGAAGAGSTVTSGAACGVGRETESSGTLKEAVWWVVEATTGLAEALAGVAAEARLLRRLSGRAEAPGTAAESDPVGTARLRDCAAPGEAALNGAALNGGGR